MYQNKRLYIIRNISFTDASIHRILTGRMCTNVLQDSAIHPAVHTVWEILSALNSDRHNSNCDFLTSLDINVTPLAPLRQHAVTYLP